MRMGESIAASIMKLTSPLLVGKAKKFRAIKADTIAAAMISLAKSKYQEKIVPSDKIRVYGKAHNLQSGLV